MYYTLARRWALALAGVIHEARGEAREPGRDEAAQILEARWSVADRAALETTLAWLRDEGDRAAFARIAGGEPGDDALKQRFVADNRAALGDKTIAAWDLGRLVAVAGWGARAGLVTEARAFAWMMPAAKEAQRRFASWADFAQNFCMGCWFWRPEESAAAAVAANALLARADSPWRQLAWDQPLDEPVARRSHVRAVTCRACGARKVRPPPVVDASAHVHCDYCGELTDLDLRVLMDGAGSARPTAVLRELTARHELALAVALAARDEAALRAIHRNIRDVMTLECPAAFSPRIADPAYRAELVDVEAEMAVVSALDDETARLGAACAEAARALQAALPVGPSTLLAASGLRVPSAPFWTMIETLLPMQQHVTRMLDARGLLARHPDRLSPDLHQRIAISMTVQSWLPFLADDDARRLLATAHLAAEYVPVPADVAIEVKHCGGCGADLDVAAGATRVVCDFCGRRVAVGAPEIDCPQCAARVSVADGASACPYCAAAFA